MRVRALLAVLALGAGASDNPPAPFVPLEPAVIQHRLELVARKLPDRRAALEALFREAGCDGGSLVGQPVPGSREPNLICTLAGQTGSEIVVGGHFDSIETGMGAVDDWSGAVLLPSLYQSLRTAPRKHRFVFAGFAAEERGLWGSRQFVSQLSAGEPSRIHAMINLECLGVGTPVVWASRADPGLLDAYSRVASLLHVEARGMNVDEVGDDDSHSFLNAHIPVLTLHSLSAGSMAILHNKRDNLTAIHAENYYLAYRLAASYLAYLDTTLP